MVKKDWTKTGKNEWENSKKHGRIHLTVLKTATYVNVAYFDKRNLWRDGKTVRFDTNAQAMNYAEGYMRRN